MLFLLQGSRSVRSFLNCWSPPSAFRRLSNSARMASTTLANDLLTNQLEVSITDAIACHAEVAFMDGSWWLGQPDKARQAYEAGPRIAGAHFYDIDDVATKTTDRNPKGLPHMMPPPSLQATFMDACGVTNQKHIIVYGQADCPFLHRAYFQIMAMRHGVAKTHLLAGSLQDWIDAGGPVENGYKASLRVDDLPPSNSYHAVDPGQSIVDMAQLKQLITTQSTDIQIVDARSAERFLAQVDEPRPGLRRGHMPGAQNICFQDVLLPESPVQLKDVGTLKGLVAGLDRKKRIIATCGSGATGCTVLAALLKAGYDPALLTLYDGSWMEWGADPEAPLVDEREQKQS